MQDEFMKETIIFDKNDKEKEFELINSIMNTRVELERAHKNFEYAEEDLIDYYSYQIKANQSKLDYLIKLAKSKNIAIDSKNIKAG